MYGLARRRVVRRRPVKRGGGLGSLFPSSVGGYGLLPTVYNAVRGLARRRRPVKRGGSSLLRGIADAMYNSLNSKTGSARRRPAVRRRRRMRGGGFFGDVWSGIKSVVPKVVGTVRKAVVDPVALAAGTLAGKIDPSFGRLAQQGVYKASDWAESKGYARRRRVVRRGGQLRLAVLPGPIGMARRRRRVVRRGGSYAGLAF